MTASGAQTTSDWDRLAVAAVLGFERPGAESPAITGSPAQWLASGENADAPSMLLRSAAILVAYERAGRRSGATTVEHVVCRDEVLRYCPPNAGRRLFQILHGEYGALLDEWCGHAVSHRVRAPDELLPELLARLAAERNHGARDQLLFVIGTRGQWLMSLNPAWTESHDADLAPHKIWATGTPKQRLDTVTELRANDPKAARELIATTWSREEGDDRVKFIESLETGLSLDDEPFLESALDDSRKTVRRAAAALLARLPQSAYVKRMTDRAAALVKFESKKSWIGKAKPKLDVTLPDKPDRDQQRDGIEFKKRGALGERASVLAQIIAGTALATWEKSGLTASQLIETACAGEWREALLIGWTEAAANQRNAAWASLLVRVHFESPDASFDDEIRLLLAAMSPDDRERAVIEIIRDRRVPTQRSLRLPQACAGPWSREFSRCVLAELQQYFGSSVAYADHGLRQTVVREFAARMTPEIAEYAESGWKRDSGQWHKGDEDMATSLAAALSFRRAMQEEFD